jgi:hypothetical protein
MRCPHPLCTGVHDNNRWSELCPRSRAAKRIRDWRYIHGDGQLGIYAHRQYVAFLRRCLNKYEDEDGQYAKLFGLAEAAREASHWEQQLAEATDKFRTAREGHRGTRRKMDTICLGPKGVITERMVLAATRDPSIRTFYWSW